eukprot:Lankesteria_metandrocarpae@DN6321_c0_g1_i1.p1
MQEDRGEEVRMLLESDRLAPAVMLELVNGCIWMFHSIKDDGYKPVVDDADTTKTFDSWIKVLQKRLGEDQQFPTLEEWEAEQKVFIAGFSFRRNLLSAEANTDVIDRMSVLITENDVE